MLDHRADLAGGRAAVRSSAHHARTGSRTIIERASVESTEKDIDL
jgi:hypothetical protein